MIDSFFLFILDNLVEDRDKLFEYCVKYQIMQQNCIVQNDDNSFFGLVVNLFVL